MVIKAYIDMWMFLNLYKWYVIKGKCLLLQYDCLGVFPVRQILYQRNSNDSCAGNQGDVKLKAPQARILDLCYSAIQLFRRYRLLHAETFAVL